VRDVSQDVLAQRLVTNKSRVSRWMNGWVILDAYWLTRVGVALALSDAEARTLTVAAASLSYEWACIRNAGGAPPLATAASGPSAGAAF
jgi:hypothetical protein